MRRATTRRREMPARGRLPTVRLLAVLLLAGPALSGAAEGDAMTLTLTSTRFAPGGEIPVRHTCEGEDISPELSWTGAPESTRSFALIVDDPDAPDPKAPRMAWVHWVLYMVKLAKPIRPAARYRRASSSRRASSRVKRTGTISFPARSI